MLEEQLRKQVLLEVRLLLDRTTQVLGMLF